MTISEWNYIVHTVNADIASLTETEAFFDSRRFKEMGEIGQLIESYILSTLAWVADTDRKKNMTIKPKVSVVHAFGDKSSAVRVLATIKSNAYMKHCQCANSHLFRSPKKLNLPAFDVYQYLDTGSSEALTEADKYEITQLANVRKYSYKKIAADTGVSVATVCNYAKKLKSAISNSK